MLANKVAMIAGAGRGIGEATTRLLASAGATVAVLDNDPLRAEQLAASIMVGGGHAKAVVADLRDEAECADAVERVVGELGTIDVLVNVAGGMLQHARWRPLREWTTDDWDRILHLNLRYVFWLARSVMPVMEAGGGGAIVNVASLSGMLGAPNHSGYGAAKAGLIQLTKTLAVEGGPVGIRANAVAAGPIVTPATTDGVTDERRDANVAAMASVVPLQRLGAPEDIARAVLYLASPMSAYVTGQTIAADGGVSVAWPFV